jgi:uracil-DNA glycosylase family 4
MPRIPKPDSCIGCDGENWLHQIGLNSRQLVRGGFSENDGHGTSGVLIVAEALGANEDADGLPLRPYAQSGSLLERAFKRCGLNRDQFRITNCIRCRPPHDHLSEARYEFNVLQHCRPNLVRELVTFKPRVILALGGIAVRELTGMSGKKQGISYIRGYTLSCVIPEAAGTPVISTFHPSFIMQGKKQYFGVLCHDLQRAVQIARHGVSDKLPRQYQPRPSLDDAIAFANRCRDERNRWLTYDIETPNSAEQSEDEREEDRSYNIVQIQFSLAEREGIVFPIEGAPAEYLEIAKRIIAMDHQKAGFYSHLFDDPRMRANGFTFGGPFPTDLYEQWHHLQPDLPANLQFTASFEGMDEVWKHLFGSDLPWYGCCDVDAPQRILARLPEQLRKRGLWDGYERLVYKVRPILDRMSERGIPINDERRRAFGLELDVAAADVDAEMQSLVPDEIKNVHPKQGYKKTPKDTSGMILRHFPRGNEGGSYQGADLIPPATIERWCRLEPFKTSSQQLIRYMKHRGHPVPMNIKKGRETSEAKELERLAKKTHDPLYRKVIWHREVRLMKSTFVDGWQPSERDGRVHTTFTFAPATLQLSSRDPNVQNAPEHEKEGRTTGLADKFQRIIEAPNGYKIVSFDHKSFHALTLAHLAQDNDYMRVVRLDIHSFLASQFLKLIPAHKLLEMRDDEMRAYLGGVKREHRAVRDGKAKRTILGWGFGMQKRTLYNTYMESFASEAEAGQMIQLLEASFPKTVKWRKSIQMKAHYDTYLINSFGAIRWFWDVFNFGPNGQLRNGEQAEQAIAYLPASNAFGMMRDEMREMAARGLDERFGYINTIHDSHVFCCADALVEECLHTVGSLMEAPSAAMNGLWCGVSASVGQNKSAKSSENPHGREEVNVNVNPIVEHPSHADSRELTTVRSEHTSGMEGRA